MCERLQQLVDGYVWLCLQLKTDDAGNAESVSWTSLSCTADIQSYFAMINCKSEVSQ